ncbi:MAG: hypothetical protein ACKVT0_04270, partial [Planctomycetaceae bacterium]
ILVAGDKTWESWQRMVTMTSVPSLGSVPGSSHLVNVGQVIQFGKDAAMKRLILLAFAVASSLGSATHADDYLLRIDTVGYVDIPADEKDPKETTLRSIEVVAHPESTFHSKVTTKVSTGWERLKVKGKFRPADDGGFEMQINYDYSIDTEQGVTTEDGVWIPNRDTMSLSTTVAFVAGEDSVTLRGPIETTKNEEGKPELRSKIQFVLHLSKYTPADQ